jgi:hypothetical protein
MKQSYAAIIATRLNISIQMEMRLSHIYIRHATPLCRLSPALERRHRSKDLCHVATRNRLPTTLACIAASARIMHYDSIRQAAPQVSDRVSNSRWQSWKPVVLMFETKDTSHGWAYKADPGRNAGENYNGNCQIDKKLVHSLCLLLSHVHVSFWSRACT